MTNQSEPACTTVVTLGRSEYGHPQPQVGLRFPRGTGQRVAKAALHGLAAEVEMATPPKARWTVQVEELGDNAGWVYLELARATAEEAERGMGVLRRLAP